MRSGWATAIVFAALLFLAPWPWYLVAVGGLLPVAVIALMALGLLPQPLLAGLLALCAATGIVAFYFIARWFGRRGPSSRPWAVAGAGGALVLVSLLPIYGGGENIATPAGKFADAWTAYRSLFRSTR
jgi:hypothetical protein